VPVIKHLDTLFNKFEIATATSGRKFLIISYRLGKNRRAGNDTVHKSDEAFCGPSSTYISDVLKRGLKIYV
jgi:hypothetical protein